MVMKQSALLKGEKIIHKCRPTALAFIQDYLIALSPIGLALVAVWMLDKARMYSDLLLAYLKALGILGLLGVPLKFSLITILWAFYLLAGLMLAILKISWKPLIGYLIILASVTYLRMNYSITEFQLLAVLALASVIWLILVDLGRRRYRYYITNFRIVIESGLLSSEERSVFYSKIVDVVMKKGFLGRLFGYGSIIPITASELGTGEEAVIAMSEVKVGKGIGVGVGGARTIKVTRSMASQVIYGVRNPERIYKMILENMRKHEGTYYLQDIARSVKNIESQLLGAGARSSDL